MTMIETKGLADAQEGAHRTRGRRRNVETGLRFHVSLPSWALMTKIKGHQMVSSKTRMCDIDRESARSAIKQIQT
jgi:hypothetical protein